MNFVICHHVPRRNSHVSTCLFGVCVCFTKCEEGITSVRNGSNVFHQYFGWPLSFCLRAVQLARDLSESSKLCIHPFIVLCSLSCWPVCIVAGRQAGKHCVPGLRPSYKARKSSVLIKTAEKRARSTTDTAAGAQ